MPRREPDRATAPSSPLPAGLYSVAEYEGVPADQLDAFLEAQIQAISPQRPAPPAPTRDAAGTYNPNEVDRYLTWLRKRRYPDSARLTDQRIAALRMVAVLCATEALDRLPAGVREQTVVQIHTVARRLAAHKLRLTHDGDRYHITLEASDPPDAIEAGGGRVPQTPQTLGRATSLSELASIVERVTSRPEGDGGSP